MQLERPTLQLLTLGFSFFVFFFFKKNSHIWPQLVSKYWGFYRPLSFAWSYSLLLCYTNWLDKEGPGLCKVLLLQGEM